MKNKDLESTIYMWFNMKYELYDKLEHDDSNYLYYEGERYADIRILKKYKFIYFNLDFWKEFRMIFPIDYYDFKTFMVKWIEDTFVLKGFTPFVNDTIADDRLKIPLI